MNREILPIIATGCLVIALSCSIILIIIDGALKLLMPVGLYYGFVLWLFIDYIKRYKKNETN